MNNDTMTLPETKARVTTYGSRYLNWEAQQLAKREGCKLKGWDIQVTAQ